MSRISQVQTRRFYPHATRLENAVAYTAPVNGTSLRLRGNVFALAFHFVVSAKTGVNDVLATLQTSHDGTTWSNLAASVTINGNGNFQIVVDEPCLEFVRIAYTDSGGTDANATITSFGLADGDPAAGGQSPEAPTGNFAVCRIPKVLDSSIPVTTTPTNGGNTFLSRHAEVGFLVMVIASRTAGSVTADTQFSHDGTTYVNTGGQFASSSTNETRIAGLTRAIGSRLRNLYTPAASFDGRVTMTLYTNGDT